MTLQRGSPGGHTSPALAGMAPSGTARRGEQHREEAVWQGVPRQKQRDQAMPGKRSGAGTVSCTALLEHSPLGKPSRAACKRLSSLPGAFPSRQDAVSPRTAWPPALTVVGEARFAQTHDKVHFHLVRSHGFGANGALETWRESGETSP